MSEGENKTKYDENNFLGRKRDNNIPLQEELGNLF
jgi:hypothetical protein